MARPRAPERSSSRPTIPPIIVFLYGIGALCLHFWLNRVCRVVPEAYLDEVFHIPQAQAYWAGSWQTWDPKITTPPGLYIYSCLFAKLLTVFGWRELGVRQLRVSVEVLLMFMPMILLQCHPRYHNYKQWSPKLLAQIMHANLNTIFCPLLFFFSALYYTDILSAFAVVEVYGWYVYFGSEKEPGGYLSSKLSAGARSVTCKIAILLFGLFAMLCRQTNVFWVAVFLGGLQAVRTLTTCTHSGPSIAARKRPISANLNVVFDPPVQDAAIEDYARTVFSLLSTASQHIPQLIGDLSPYLGMLGAFAGFVVWNGGVVLGDKENHIASIHLPQMLYIWPCIVFFSWPVLLPTIAKLSRNGLPRSLVALAAMGLMLLAVRFNTVIHPFTLADNRHYVFYVFRILLKHPAIKYAAVPVYFMCAWLVIDAMGGMSRSNSSTVRRNTERERMQHETPSSLSVPQGSTRVSFVLVWLVATTLSLVTAPLVEPRYFIIPWLVWRLNIPVDSKLTDSHERSGTRDVGVPHRTLSLMVSYRLWIETAWYLLVNLVTCYIFLYKGFEWPQEPGKVQHFMW